MRKTTRTVKIDYIAEPLRSLAVPIGSITLDPENVRDHKEADIEIIAASLKKYGLRKAVVVRKDGMVVKAGNGTVLAAKKLGWTHVAAVVVDESEADAAGYAIADNRTAEHSTWSFGTLADTIEKYKLDPTEHALGFTPDEIASVLSTRSWDEEPDSESGEKSGAAHNRHRSRQDYGTPVEFLDVVRRRFGTLMIDLACTEKNKIEGVRQYFTPNENSLEQDWASLVGNAWLNPPFDPIAPWAEKLSNEMVNRPFWTLFLIPASVGAMWWGRFVHGKGLAMPLHPRITFVGESDPYPSELALVAYGYGISGFEPWIWKQ